ncbi:MAG: DUF4062 domain-containing protein [Acidimicrobiia bacterium]|nr:DUF4062 domain-containing protein [Acidimicrobiia bacterium]MCY4433478.1 DUF4062 domain-containing protein [bacterium]
MDFDPIPPVVVDRSPPEPLTPDEVRSWMSDQTVFVSSTMAGMTAEREAVRDAVEALGGRVVLFERLGGRDDDAPTAYLSGVRSSDIYVGILGERYGKPEQTGYSPTHTEYNEAVKAGLRISVWATTGEMDGRQRDFLEEIRTFHTTGSYSDPQELSEGLSDRLAEVAAAANSPWCKAGTALFRANRHTDFGNQISVEAAIRDGDILAALEGLRPNNWNQKQSTRITCAGRTYAVGIDSVTVETKSGRSRLVRIEATKEDAHGNGTGLPGFSLGDRSPDDLTEIALRVALLGEPNPLGQMAPMAEMANPISHTNLMELDEDSFTGAAEVLLVETLVGSGRVERITGLQIGPAHSGRPIRLEWVTPRQYTNVEPGKRQIEGKLHC